MTSREERIQVLYEIALSIGDGDGLEATAGRALSAYLRKLNCAAGAVLRRRNETADRAYETVASIPAQIANQPAYQAGVDLLSGGIDPSTLPTVVRSEEPTRTYLLDLPDFGVLLLVKSRASLGERTVAALADLNEKLADACRAERLRRDLRTERNRFETVFETIPEPVVSVATDGEQPTVQAANTAFVDAFAPDGTDPVGRPLGAVFPGSDDRADPDWPTNDTPIKQRVERTTADGPRTFQLRTAPVGRDAERAETFGLYVDITDQADRRQTVEELYRAAQDFLRTTDRISLSERAVDVASSVLDFSTSGIHLYDREAEALVPAATVGIDDVFDRAPPIYDDRSTVIWQVYRSRDPVMIDDTTTYDGTLPGERTAAQSALVLPLSGHGVFITSADEPGAFDETDRYFGQLLAAMLRTALDRVARERRLRDIREATTEFVTASDAEAVASMLVEHASESLDLPLTSVWAHEEPDGALHPVASTDSALELFDDIPSFEPGESIAWEVFESGQPRKVESVAEDPHAHNPDSPIGSELLAPIGDFGVIAAGSRIPRDFSQSEFQLLRWLVADATTALRFVRQREEATVLDQILSRVLRHNIRNAMTSINGRAELLRDRPSTELDADEQAGRILRRSRQLLSTVESAREMQAIVTNREQQTVTDVRAAVSAAADAVRETYPSAEIVVESVPGFERTTHPELRAAFRHAIENGVVHSNAPTPRVSVTGSRRSEAILIEVADNGPGIPPAERETLQAGEETQLTHGSGVGLWIIDRVTAYSGGAVEFDTSSEGTTVLFRFPR